MGKEEDKVGIEADLAKELEIDETKLEEELIRQPSKFFYWGALWARASRLRRKSRLQMKEKEASLCKAFRERAAEETPGLRITEKMLNDYLYTHPEYLQAEKDLIDKEYMDDLLSIAKEAFKERHQTLLELRRTVVEERAYGSEIEAMRRELEERESKKINRKKNKEADI